MGSLFEEILPAAKSKGLPAVVVTCGPDSTVYPIGPDATEDSVIAVLGCGQSSAFEHDDAIEFLRQVLKR
jgi:hypothetical protein